MITRKHLKGLLTVLLPLLMAFALIPAISYADSALTGNGTAEDPYLISDEAGLREFAELAASQSYSGCAKLSQDITLTSAWTSIAPSTGYVTDAFAGVFDGDGHTIKGLNISSESTNQGLFGVINGATIKNLKVEGSVSSSKAYVGGIVGKVQQGMIENCSFSGTVSTSVTSTSGYAGGITGYAGNSTTQTAQIKGCVNRAEVTGGCIGGLAGYIKYGTIDDSYNTGTVAGAGRSGGIAGQAQNNVTITNCYSIGANNGTSSTKGDIVDFLYSNAKLENCYYLNGTAPNGTGTGTVTDCDVIDKDTLLSKLGSAFAADENNINDGYPILAWEAGAEPVPKDPKIKITGNTSLYMVNSGTPATTDLAISYIDMDNQPAVIWSVTEGTDVIRMTDSATAGAKTITPLKAGKATITAKTEDETYSDEVEISVYPYITAIAMNETPFKGETYIADVTVLGGDAYDFDNYPALNTFTWKYFDSRSDYQSNPSGGTVISGKGNEITVPEAASGKWLTVTLSFNGRDITPGSPYGKDVLDHRVAIDSVSITGAVAEEGILTATTGDTLTAVLEGVGGEEPTKALYQWSVKNETTFSDIEGATGKTYKIPDTIDSLNKEYRVKVTGENNSEATSPSVKVTRLSEAAQQEITDTEYLETAAAKYESLNILTPKFGENNNNAATFLENDLAAKGYEDITVSIKSVEKRTAPNGGIAAIANDGAITWFYLPDGKDPTNIYEMPYSNMPYARFDVVFTLQKGTAHVDMSKTVDINWDNDKLCQYLQETILDQITWDTIRGENTAENTAMSDLSLPVYPKNVDTRMVKLSWTSENTDAIMIQDPSGDASTIAYGDRIGKVARGMEDKTTKLTVTVEYTQTNNVPSTEAAIAQLKKEFNIAVPAYTEEEIRELVTNEINSKLDAGFGDNGLKDYLTGEPLDYNDVRGDIKFPTTKELKIDGAEQPVTITSNNTDVIDYPKDSEGQPQKNAARAYVYRPLPDEGSKEVTVRFTVTDKATGVEVFRDFPVKVTPLTQNELDDALQFMTKSVEGYWDGLKGANTEQSNVTTDLTPFQEIKLAADGTLQYAYSIDDVTDMGVRPERYVENPAGHDSDYRRFNLSDDKYLSSETLILSEDTPEEGIAVTIDSYLSHSIYGAYYEKFRDNSAKAAVFQPFYRQHAEVTVTLKGKHVHQLVHFPAKDAQEKEDGNIEHWMCTKCGKYFADENAETELSRDDVIIPKTGGDEPEPEDEQKPEKAGTVIKVGGMKYKVTSANKKTPTVSITEGSNKKTVSVPSAITYKGIKYKVTAIAPKAFFKNKKLVKFTVGKNIKTIGAQAFAKCKKLKTFTVGKNVTKIGAKVFSGSNKLKTLIIKSKKLKKASVKKAFSGSKIKTVKVKVGSKKVNKKFVKKYKKVFTKKICGRKVIVK